MTHNSAPPGVVTSNIPISLPLCEVAPSAPPSSLCTAATCASMANAAVMGPPPSPKEPRRSGRRSVPSGSTSKSPGGSPAADSAPKAKENGQRPPLPTPNHSNKNKRGKQEEHDDALEERKHGTNGTNGNGNARAKRKGKDKDKTLATLDNVENIIPDDEHGDALLEEGGLDAEGEDEEGGITRCICGAFYASLYA